MSKSTNSRRVSQSARVGDWYLRRTLEWMKPYKGEDWQQSRVISGDTLKERTPGELLKGVPGETGTLRRHSKSGKTLQGRSKPRMEATSRKRGRSWKHVRSCKGRSCTVVIWKVSM